MEKEQAFAKLDIGIATLAETKIEVQDHGDVGARLFSALRMILQGREGLLEERKPAEEPGPEQEAPDD